MSTTSERVKIALNESDVTLGHARDYVTGKVPSVGSLLVRMIDEAIKDVRTVLGELDA